MVSLGHKLLLINILFETHELKKLFTMIPDTNLNALEISSNDGNYTRLSNAFLD